MKSIKKNYEFIGETGSFKAENPDFINYLYFPLVNEAGMMSSITANLHGDSKTSHNSFFLEPAHVENLHNSRGGRNFWVNIDGETPWSVAGNSARQKAEKYLKRSLKMNEQVLTSNHPIVALSLNNLGLLYSFQNKY